ncbi:MAG: hypothetical protein ACH37Z_12290 [Anaerolineae bacterium]
MTIPFPSGQPLTDPLAQLARFHDLAETVQGLLDLEAIDDVAGDLKQWGQRWGYTLRFRQPQQRETA